ncbi:Hsp20/alpha crystallin family protein [Methanobacterium petrolearium]|uniref:Hsp20/alpha crystallin family protein n=2 Tax=Methanobacterium petrolearium TaxID=710190 RepID=UPI001AE4A0ED|nr:Hsp20/alpha crystallin family protein [Methanobacterium petrolearium]MBP1946300.1 HSP20 family protein [Methanobacterium petrolearium]
MSEKKGTAEQLFSDMLQTLKERQGDLDKAIAKYQGGPAKPAMDVIENDDNIVVKTDLPGVNREDIKIDLTEDSLEIRAEHSEETDQEGVTYHKKERRYASAARTLILPAKVKLNDVTAKFDNGVLTIIMPKLEKKETFEVKVE